jgi:two-component system, NtrC family, response regulator GlrR
MPTAVSTMATMEKRILLIDDEPEIRDLLTLALIAKGYETFGAASGAEGKRIALEKAPDLIISDLLMEDTDGLSLIAELNDTMPGIPVILLTGVLFDPETVRETIKRNVKVYLQKTAKLQTILDEVDRICPP